MVCLGDGQLNDFTVYSERGTGCGVPEKHLPCLCVVSVNGRSMYKSLVPVTFRRNSAKHNMQAVQRRTLPFRPPPLEVHTELVLAADLMAP